jgi:Ca2+-binding EF-hand superfamily protein
MNISAASMYGMMPAGFRGMSGMRRPNPDQMADKASDKIIDKMDTSGDGMLSLDELGDEADQELFSEIDADGDGLLTKDELQSGIKQHQEEFMSGLRDAMQKNGGMPDMSKMQRTQQAMAGYQSPEDALMSMLFDAESELSVSV